MLAINSVTDTNPELSPLLPIVFSKKRSKKFEIQILKRVLNGLCKDLRKERT